MIPVTRDELKTIFKKVKHLRLPPNLETINFSKLHYLGWMDESDNICYLACEIDGKIEAVRGEMNQKQNRALMKHLCSICHQHRDFHEVGLFTAKNKRMPKGVTYRVSGVYICRDFERCNMEMKSGEEIVGFLRKVVGG